MTAEGPLLGSLFRSHDKYRSRSPVATRKMWLSGTTRVFSTGKKLRALLGMHAAPKLLQVTNLAPRLARERIVSQVDIPERSETLLALRVLFCHLHQHAKILDLVFIEQPLGWDDIVDHAELARHIQTPICLDESVTSPRVAEQAVRIGACEYINIKVWRSGGLANAVAIHDIAQDAGIPVWLGGMSESGIGKAIGIELATLPNFTYPNDLGSVAKMFNTNLTRDVPTIKSNLTYDPRLGTLPEPDPDRLAEMTRASMTISS